MCLRCGKEESSYCEECYQELLAENLRLKAKLEKMEE